MKIAIYGYGNLGKGVEKAIRQNDDMELFGVFTRRNPDSLKIMTEGVGVYSSDDIEKYKNEIERRIYTSGSCRGAGRNPFRRCPGFEYDDQAQ